METTPTFRRTCAIPRQGHGQRSSKKTKTKARTRSFNGYGFLTHRFLPVMDAARELVKCRQVEREFFTSLFYLARLYGFAPLDVSDKIYPDNIRCAYHHAAEVLTARQPAAQLVILQDKTHAAALATIQPMDTGATLYYIPVRPLWQLMRDSSQKKLAALLLSVYAYLYQVVKIPYYTESSSYLCGTYEMLQEWITDDPSNFEADQYAAQVNNFNALKWCGEQIRNSIRHPYHLQQFQQRVTDFKAASEWETAWQQASSSLLELYNQYPDRSIFDNIHEGWIDPKSEERVYPEQYLSFYWDYDDCLFETIDSDLQEKTVTEEPIAMQLFDRPQQHVVTGDLEFEQRLLDLLTDISSLL